MTAEGRKRHNSFRIESADSHTERVERRRNRPLLARLTER